MSWKLGMNSHLILLILSNILFWKLSILFISPLLFLPLIFVVNTIESKCAFVILLMLTYWMTEVVELPVTSLLPIVLFPVLGIISTERVCQYYLQENNMLFMGNMIFATIAEKCDIHKRIALAILMSFGSDTKWMILGFMLATAFLSASISSVAVTMMLPIVDAVVNEVYLESKINAIQNNHLAVTLDAEDSNKTSTQKIDELKELKYLEEYEKFRKCIYLSVAYAANIGSIATLTGAGPNLVLKFVIEQMFETTKITYGNWLMYGLPLSLVIILLTWAIFYARLCCLRTLKKKNVKLSTERIHKKYEELGSVKYNEIAILIMLSLMIALWIFRNPNFMKGWCTFIPDSKSSDTNVSVLIAILLFILPYKMENGLSSMNWEPVEYKLQWGVVLLRGGGFAIAGVINDLELFRWIGYQLFFLHNLSKEAILLVFCIFTSFFTEILSNTATATIIIPIAAQIAINLYLNPLMTSIPIAIVCSFSFMLPIGSSTNAIVCSHAGIKTTDMLLIGFIIKCLSATITLSSLYLLGSLIFDIESFSISAIDGARNFSSSLINQTISKS